MVAESKHVQVGDYVRLIQSERKLNKLSYGYVYKVLSTETNKGYVDGSVYITELKFQNGVVNLKMEESYFEILPLRVQIKKKFQVGDKVICVKNTPQVQEGWIGFIIPEKCDFGFVAENEQGEGYAFTEDELELLNVSNTVRLEGVVHNVEVVATLDPEHTGGSVNYYKVHVAHPTTLPEAYDAEANDIIESLGLTFAEGNLFKAIWRMAADRNGKKKKGNNSIYDAEKLVFFAERVLVQERAKHESE